VAETHFDEWVAQHYAKLWPELFEADLLDAAVEFLADLAGSGPALEFGIGTGRVAIPLARHGLRVQGIELSKAMVDELRHQDSELIAVTIGDFATATVEGPFSLVYLLRNTITNLISQDEQVEAFRNAARHLDRSGCFVIENYIPELQRLPPGETQYVFKATRDHIAVGDYDLAAQIEVSRHWWVVDGELRTFRSPHRYVWPSELDLMAKMAGLRLRERWSDWHRAPFGADSRSHISVWEKAARSAKPASEPEAVA
jgi:SAM-dependent methyltransferase